MVIPRWRIIVPPGHGVSSGWRTIRISVPWHGGWKMQMKKQTTDQKSAKTNNHQIITWIVREKKDCLKQSTDTHACPWGRMVQVFWVGDRHYEVEGLVSVEGDLLMTSLWRRDPHFLDCHSSLNRPDMWYYIEVRKMFTFPKIILAALISYPWGDPSCR